VGPRVIARGLLELAAHIAAWGTFLLLLAAGATAALLLWVIRADAATDQPRRDSAPTPTFPPEITVRISGGIMSAKCHRCGKASIAENVGSFIASHIC